MPHDTAIYAAGIHANYGHLPVLRGVDCTLLRGTLTMIAGRNGAGKTTLLEILAGVRAPHAGTVQRTGSVGLVLQRPLAPLGLPLTVRDAVRIGAARPARGSRPRRSLRAVAAAGAEALAAVDMTRLAHHDFAGLSGGQRQRVLIAQGLATGAEILLLDEPAAGLDAESRARTRTILLDAAHRGVTVCAVSHDAADLAIADQVLTIESGSLTTASGALRPEAIRVP